MCILKEVTLDQHQYLPSFPDHDIVIVTISDAQDVSSYTVAGAWQRELFNCLVEFVPGDRLHKQQQGSDAWVVLFS